MKKLAVITGLLISTVAVASPLRDSINAKMAMRIKLLAAAISAFALLTGVAAPSTAQSLPDLDGNAM